MKSRVISHCTFIIFIFNFCVVYVVEFLFKNGARVDGKKGRGINTIVKLFGVSENLLQEIIYNSAICLQWFTFNTHFLGGVCFQNHR